MYWYIKTSLINILSLILSTLLKSISKSATVFFNLKRFIWSGQTELDNAIIDLAPNCNHYLYKFDISANKVVVRRINFSEIITIIVFI